MSIDNVTKCPYNNIWTDFCHDSCKLYDRKKKRCTYNDIHYDENNILGHLSYDSGMWTFRTPTQIYLSKVVDLICNVLHIKPTIEDDCMYEIIVRKINKKENK